MVCHMRRPEAYLWPGSAPAKMRVKSKAVPRPGISGVEWLLRKRPSVALAALKLRGAGLHQEAGQVRRKMEERGWDDSEVHPPTQSRPYPRPCRREGWGQGAGRVRGGAWAEVPTPHCTPRPGRGRRTLTLTLTLTLALTLALALTLT